MRRFSEVMTEGEYPSIESQPLAGIELEALTYWKRFLPTLSRQLESQDPPALETAIRARWWQIEIMILQHQAKQPSPHRLQIEEVYRDLLFPAPEPHTS